MMRLIVLALALMLSTACSYESRQMWGAALYRAADNMQARSTVYCRTDQRGNRLVSYCY